MAEVLRKLVDQKNPMISRMQQYGWARDRVVTLGSERDPTEQDGYMAEMVAAGLVTKEVKFVHRNRNITLVYRFTKNGLDLIEQYTAAKS